MYDGIFMDIAGALEALGERHGSGDLLGRWENIRWLNTPGPLYCGDGDNCGTGPLYAPNNVFVDDKGYEFIFRQPTSYFELHQVLKAAWADPFRGYAADGNEYWTYEAIKAWWKRRPELEAEITRRRARLVNLTYPNDYIEMGSLGRWQDYLDHGMRHYLRMYAFPVEERRVPDEGAILPDL